MNICASRTVFSFIAFAFLSFLVIHLAGSYAPAADNPLEKMRDETVSYFKPLAGKVTAVDNKKITVDIGSKDGLKRGMRFQILREEAAFKHPVTKEPLGKLESLTGKFEIREVGPDSSSGEILEGNAKEGDKVRISEIKVALLFCQSKDMEWHLADSYYQGLKDSGRFNLIDTSLDTDVPSKAFEEARKLKADVLLLLSSKNVGDNTALNQRLYWVSDGSQLSEINTVVDAQFAKKLGAGDSFFKSVQEDAWLRLELPVDARHITVCDIDGDGKKEIVLASGKGISVYSLAADIEPALGGLKIEGRHLDNILWLDSIDLKGNGRDDIIITTMKGSDVVSFIYEFNGSELALLHKDSVFLRKLDGRLVAQAYSQAEGFTGDVYTVSMDGTYKKGNSLQLPKGVNIYDFVYLDDPRAGRLLLAYDSYGFLNVYNDKGTSIWRSKGDSGGFLNSYTKKAPSVMLDKGEWSIKDRLFVRGNEVLSVKRFPLLEMMKGLGFKSAQIRALWWNGLSMEESVLVENIKGTLFDYTVDGDKIMTIVSPLFGIKPGNILKGENPIQMELIIYKMRGK